MKKNPLIGIMEGRLSKPQNGKFQSFPCDTWEKEFELAREVGFDSIEMVFDRDNYECHPLMTAIGIAKTRKLIQKTGVQVLSICADFFMSTPLHQGPEKDRELSYAILQKLISNAQALGVKDIVLPCVDQSSLNSEEEKELLKNYLKKIRPLLEKTQINLALECDLAPISFRKFLDHVDLPRIKVNYDTGNSASLGYSLLEELRSYGTFISSVHIKDRKLHGTTVPLGTGDTDFVQFFQELNKIKYPGSFIIQGARGEDEISVASNQLQFTRKLIQKYFLN